MQKIEFARYELWLQPGLEADPQYLTSTASLEEAQQLGDKQAAAFQDVPHTFVSIDYIALHDQGRTERFWVREIESGIWKELGAPEPSVEVPTI